MVGSKSFDGEDEGVVYEFRFLEVVEEILVDFDVGVFFVKIYFGENGGGEGRWISIVDDLVEIEFDVGKRDVLFFGNIIELCYDLFNEFYYDG